MGLGRLGISKARFCPWCGVESLEHDKYKCFRDDKPEYICQTCGAAFRIMESTRRQDANRMMAHERRLRVPTNPTTPEQDIDHFRAACKNKFKALKHAHGLEWRRVVGEEMRSWLLSDEAKAIRGYRTPTAQADATVPSTPDYLGAPRQQKCESS